jgi:hypothetical protein
MRFIISALAGFLVFTGYQTAYGCTCSPPHDVVTSYSQATIVFSGEVTALDSQKVTLKVARMWKGAPTDEVTLRVDSPCSFRFAAGERYLVYTMRAGERQKAHACSRTVLLARAEEDMKELERLSKRREAVSRNDTSSAAAKSNNGMHPTADTPPLIYFQRRGAAGDAER